MTHEFVRRFNPPTANRIAPATKLPIGSPLPMGMEIHPAMVTRAESAGVRIAVHDSGIGLSPEEQQKLFTQFFRAPHPVVREASGTGLGLAITRALVELHGGTITADSAPGQGATFNVTLPAAHDLTG